MSEIFFAYVLFRVWGGIVSQGVNLRMCFRGIFCVPLREDLGTCLIQGNSSEKKRRNHKLPILSVRVIYVPVRFTSFSLVSALALPKSFENNDQQS